MFRAPLGVHCKPITMTTLSAKRAFIKANKPLAGETLTNAIITSKTEEELDALVIAIQENPLYSPEEETVVSTTTSVPTLELEGVEQTEKFGALLHLAYIGKTKKQSAKFAYGNSFLIVSKDLRLKAMKIEVGAIFAIKADTVELNENGFYTGRVNWGADEKITSLNAQIDAFQEVLVEKSAQHALKYGMTLEQATAEITADSKAKDIANVKLPEINF